MSAGARFLAWGRLARLSLAPSALADAAAGLALGGAGALPAARETALALAASACVYHGGMVLNDWADRDEDRVARADRPIPSGAIAARTALLAGLLLVAASIALAALVAPRAGLWMAGLAALVLAYDFIGRGPLRGPFLLGACRAANLGFGVFVARELGLGHSELEPAFAPLFVALYFVYVASVSVVARLEDVSSDAAVGNLPRWALGLASLALLSLPCWHATEGLVVPRWSSLGLAALAAGALLREVARSGPWTRADAGRATGLGLRRLLVFSALVALASVPARSVELDGVQPLVSAQPAFAVAAAILCGFPLSVALRKVFPPT
ncbi:MAG: hypothetical protein FJ294_13120 [Planctomycetes bacterium]|nr:hypothetical protein [Planctomycetota bacterium]